MADEKYRYFTSMDILRCKLIISEFLRKGPQAALLAITVLAAALPAAPASAQSAATAAKLNPPQKFQDWQMKCEPEPKRCYIYQRTDLQQTGQQVLNVVLGNIGPEGTQVMHFTVPLGIFIPPGIAMKVDDGQQINVPVHTCTPSGCEAMLNMEPKILASLEGAKATNVAFLDAVTRKQITIGVSMAGFAEAYAALRKALSFQ